MEWLEGDNNSQVKIQLFAWGLTLWGLSGRSAGGGGGGGGGSASETEATYKGFVLVFKPLVVNIWKQLQEDRHTSKSERWQFYTNFVGGCEVTQLSQPMAGNLLKRRLWCSLDVLIQSCSHTSARSYLH